MLVTDDANAAFVAYSEIKRRIVETEYRVGEKLSEARLAADTGLGRSPIRSALARLKTEGWVSVSPQSGTYVKALSNRDVEEVTELRLLLEMHSTAAAAEKITDAEIERLKRAFRSHGPLAEAGDVEAFILLDSDVHNTIYRAADNGLIAGILTDLRDKVQWIRRACAVSSERVHDGYDELRQVFEALAARDADAAAARMRVHIHNAAAFCRTVDMAKLSERSRQQPALSAAHSGGSAIVNPAEPRG